MSDKIKLWEISEEIREVERDLYDEEKAADAVRRLGDLKIDLKEKIISVRYVLREQTMTIDAIKDEITRLKAISDTYKNAKGRLEEYCIQHMDLARIDHVRQNGVDIKIVRNPKSVKIEDELVVQKDHPEWVTEEVLLKVDRRAVMDHFKATGEIPEGTDIVQGRRLKY